MERPVMSLPEENWEEEEIVEENAVWEPEVAEVEIVGKATVKVEAGKPFVETIRQIGRAYLGSFRVRVYEDGEWKPVSPDDAPETIAPGMKIKIVPADKFGN